MLWFRLGAVLLILAALIWASGLLWAVVSMFSFGASTQSIVEDPFKNGTAAMYIMLLIVEVFITAAGAFGLVIAFKVWRNNYQIDHLLRHYFIIWLGCWGVGMLALLSISIYMLMRGKDHQENMAVLYEAFTRNAQDQRFVASLEKYQKEKQCCGVYGAEDWFMLQFRTFSGAGGAGGFPLGGSMDTYMMNPSTGRCHYVPPVVPPGCGLLILEDTIHKVRVVAACAIAQVLVAIAAGVLGWYCFFYWLEKEVIVIPEDEVSNIIIIEPSSRSSVTLPNRSTLRREDDFGYLQLHPPDSRQQSPKSDLYHDIKQYRDTRRSIRDNNRNSLAHFTSKPREIGFFSRKSVVHLTPEEILREQERALGGHVLAEMHVRHKSTEMLRTTNSRGVHHATVAIVRNKGHRQKPGVSPKASHHGQTGNLAQDITDMNAASARHLIEDVIVPLTAPGLKPKAIQIPVGARIHSRSRHRSFDRTYDTDRIGAQNVIESLAAIARQNSRGRVLQQPSVIVDRHGVVELHAHNQNVTVPRILPSLRAHGQSQNHHNHSANHHTTEPNVHRHDNERGHHGHYVGRKNPLWNDAAVSQASRIRYFESRQREGSTTNGQHWYHTRQEQNAGHHSRNHGNHNHDEQHLHRTRAHRNTEIRSATMTRNDMIRNNFDRTTTVLFKSKKPLPDSD